MNWGEYWWSRDFQFSQGVHINDMMKWRILIFVWKCSFNMVVGRGDFAEWHVKHCEWHVKHCKSPPPRELPLPSHGHSPLIGTCEKLVTSPLSWRPLYSQICWCVIIITWLRQLLNGLPIHHRMRTYWLTGMIYLPQSSEHVPCSLKVFSYHEIY